MRSPCPWGALAESQQGHLTRAQARRLGLTDREIDRLISSSEWRVIHRGVFRVAGVAESWHGTLIAACLAAAADSFASHRSAAALWDLDGVDRKAFELSLYTGQCIGGVIVHRLRPCDRPPTRVIHDVRVTLVERTLLDLAGVVARRIAGLALDDALRRRLTNLDRLWRVWETDGGRGRKGTKILRQLLAARDDRDGLLATRFEEKMLRILRRIEVHRLVPQFLVRDGLSNYYLDFAYPHARLGIECHSIKWHMGEERFKRDLVRDRRLKLLGWTMLYFSWDDVVFAPEKVEAEVRAALAALTR